MRVVAKSLGYYRFVRYREGAVFDLEKPEDLRSWMQPAEEVVAAPSSPDNVAAVVLPRKRGRPRKAGGVA